MDLKTWSSERLKERFGHIDNRFGWINQRIDDACQSLLDLIDRRFDQTNERLKRIEMDISDLRQKR